MKLVMQRPDVDPNEAMDVCLAFFINLHHLGDWIAATDPALKPSIVGHVRARRDLGLIRDLCNGSKHLTVTRASVDANFLTSREYVPAPLNGSRDGPDYRLVMLADGEKIDLTRLADQGVASWSAFFAAHSLDVH